MNLRSFFQHEKNQLLLVFLLGVVLRLLLLPFSQVVDADAVSRILNAQKLLDAPRIITDGVWAPLHYYWVALSMLLTGNQIWGPKLLHILFAAATVYPIYLFTKREFNARGAIFSALLYTLSPLVIRNSFHALSGIPFAFFLAWSFYFLSKAFREPQQLKHAIFAGLCISMSAGIRYEAWLIIALLTGVGILFKQWKSTFVFWGFAMIFPLYWMATGYFLHGDLLVGLSGAYRWNIELEGVNDLVSTLDRVQRLIFFPMSWITMLSPLLVLMGLFWWGYLWKQKAITRAQLIWILPFAGVFCTYIYKAYYGTLLMQHRFSISLLLLSVPMFSMLFSEGPYLKWRKTLSYVALASLIPLSYLWPRVAFEKAFFFSETLYKAVENIRWSTYKQGQALPRLENQKINKLSETLHALMRSDDGLILDFISWEATYFLALQSENNPKQLFIAGGAKHQQPDLEQLKSLLTSYPHGYFVYTCNGKFSDYINEYASYVEIKGLENYPLSLDTMGHFDDVFWLKYQRLNHEDSKDLEPMIKSRFNCEAGINKDYYIKRIKQDVNWLNMVKQKADENGRSLEEMMDIEATWMLDQHLQMEQYKNQVKADSLQMNGLYKKAQSLSVNLDVLIEEEALRLKEDDQRIKKYIQDIKADPDWLAKVDEKAKSRGVSIDEMLEIEARWLVEEENKIKTQINRIRADEKWLAEVEAKAKNKGITLDEMLKIEALYLLEIEARVAATIDRIKSDPKWLAEMETKAQANNISLDEMLEIDARYIVSQENP